MEGEGGARGRGREREGGNGSDFFGRGAGVVVGVGVGVGKVHIPGLCYMHAHVRQHHLFASGDVLCHQDTCVHSGGEGSDEIQRSEIDKGGGYAPGHAGEGGKETSADSQSPGTYITDCANVPDAAPANSINGSATVPSA